MRSLVGTIGVAVGADIRDGNKFFNGTIDDVRVYNVALTPNHAAVVATGE